jgi:hypothetical protein
MLKSTIIRIVAYAALFALVLPVAFSVAGFGSSFAFTGNILAALGVGVAYMVAMFAVAGAWSLFTAPFKLTTERRLKMWPITGASFLLATSACLLGAHLLPFLGLTVIGWLPALIGGTVGVVVMHFTMPPRSASASATSAS